MNPQLFIFSVFKIASFSILIANKVFRVTVLLLVYFLRSIYGTGSSSHQTALQCLSTINMLFSDEDKILIKHINTLIKHTYTRRGITSSSAMAERPRELGDFKKRG